MRVRSGVVALGAMASACLAILQCSSFDGSSPAPATDAAVADAGTTTEPIVEAGGEADADAGPSCTGQLVDDFNRAEPLEHPRWSSYEYTFPEGSAGGAGLEDDDAGGHRFVIFVPAADADAGDDSGVPLAERTTGAALVAVLDGATSEVDMDVGMSLAHEEAASWYAVFFEVIVDEGSGSTDRASTIVFNNDFGLNTQSDRDAGGEALFHFEPMTIPLDEPVRLHLAVTLGPNGSATLATDDGSEVTTPFTSNIGRPVQIRLGLVANGTAPTAFARYTSVSACWR